MAIFIIPSTVSAALSWNPTSWFIKAPAPAVQKTETVTPQPSQGSVAKEKIVTQVIKIDNPELQARIDFLVRQNGELLAKLNECTLKPADKAIKVTATADEDKKRKLENIDQEILAIINSYFSKISGSTSCADLYQRKANFGEDSLAGKRFYKECSVPIPKINQLLEAYRVADNKMTHSNIDALSELAELQDYLLNIYIKYR